MKNLKITLWGGLLVTSLLWWFSDQSDYSSLNNFIAWRNLFNQYSGLMAMMVMSFAMILSTRPVFLEKPFGGLDKLYRLHKWLGISALVLAVSHWLSANAPKWLSALGWLERHGRRQRPSFPEGSFQQLFMDQRHLAETLGEWAFYLAALLMILALVKRFPYRRFFQTHRVLALTYLVLVFHSVILLRFDFWGSVISVLLVVMMALGSIAAVLALVRKRASRRPVAGSIAGVVVQPALNTLAVDISLEPGWPGHQAGQFAFVTLHADEGPHPFTIASQWQEDGKLRFVIKALGDYTQTLAQRLRIGDPVTVEGPYGQFNFAGEAKRQIWISGGIGITPFIARMQALTGAGDGKEIDLFHTTVLYDPEIMARLAQDACNAGVKLHTFWDQRAGRLELKHILNAVPDWQKADIWFCGPSGLGTVLRQGLLAIGFPEAHFHQELFEMR